jgi:hypothetical protein
MTIERALEKHRQRLLRLSNVVGTGIGEQDGKQVILVFVRQKLPESELPPAEIVPPTLEGYKTAVQPEVRVGLAP